MLNDLQKKAAFEINGNTILSASPGSGKTKTLISRAEHKLDSLPNKKTIALITYTNSAADEIASRLVSQYPIFIGTIHRFCLEFILRPFGWIYNWTKPRVIAYDEILYFLENNRDIQFGDSPFDKLNCVKRTLDGEIDTNVDWDSETQLTTVAQRYFEYLSKINAVDLNEILYRSYKIIIENNFVSISLANKFYEILIDEFQDTNIFQYNIFRIINESGPVTFFMVGDERQRIYRFVGALENAFQSAQKDFSAQNEILNETYRSSDEIVNGYCKLFNNHPVLVNRAKHKDLNAPIYLKDTTKSNHDSYLLSYVKHLTEKTGVFESEIAILSTQWRDSLNASRVLRKKFNVVGLGALPHPTRNLNNSTFGLLRSLSKFINNSSVGYLRAVKRAVELHLLENNFNYDDKSINIFQNRLIFELQNLNKDDSITDGMNNISNMFSEIFNFDHCTFTDILERIKEDEIPFWTIGKYLKTLSEIDGITINTIHQAKGLEYDAVILDNINENKIPYQKCIDRRNWLYETLSPERIEDGRNLFYVALSRARKYLIILHNWKPSMFINLLR